MGKILVYDQTTDTTFYSDEDRIKAACKEVAEKANRSLEKRHWVSGREVQNEVMKVLSKT